MPWRDTSHIAHVRAGAASPNPSGLAHGTCCTPWIASSRDRRAVGILRRARLSATEAQSRSLSSVLPPEAQAENLRVADAGTEKVEIVVETVIEGAARARSDPRPG